VLVRSARDLAALWNALAVEPTAIPRVLPCLRVGLLRSDPLLGSDVDPACVEAVEVAGRALAELGHEVEEAHPPALEGFVAAISTGGGRSRVRAGQAAWIEQRIGRPLCEGDLSPEMMTQVEMARAQPTASVNPEAQCQVVTRLDELQSWWEDYDLLVTPTLRMPPWPHGESAAVNTGAFCLPFSLTGQPVVDAPVHTEGGVPVGVQIVGRHGRDEDLLAVVRDLETVLGWDRRAPAL
jgi:amidase